MVQIFWLNQNKYNDFIIKHIFVLFKFIHLSKMLSEILESTHQLQNRLISNSNGQKSI